MAESHVKYEAPMTPARRVNNRADKIAEAALDGASAQLNEGFGKVAIWVHKGGGRLEYAMLPRLADAPVGFPHKGRSWRRRSTSRLEQVCRHQAMTPMAVDAKADTNKVIGFNCWWGRTSPPQAERAAHNFTCSPCCAGPNGAQGVSAKTAKASLLRCRTLGAQ